jgi:hypothetical protein
MGASTNTPQTPTPPASRLTAAEVIARCAAAMGGQARIDALKTLRIGAVYPDHGDKIFITEIKRPNMSYEAASFLVFDGQRACLLKGPDYKSGPQLVDEQDLTDFDVIVGSFFPAFFDFPSDYLGAETVEGREMHKIRPKLPHGAELVYSIDGQTWLPAKFSTRMTIRGRSFGSERGFSDYKNVRGILYPHGFTYPGRDRTSVIQGRIASVEINPVLDEAHFTIPKNIR